MSFGLFKVVFCISFLIFGFQSNFSDKNTDLPNSFSCSERDSLELLDSAADAGLTTAYDLMAHIYKEQGNNSAALNAKQCFLKRLRISHQK